MNRIHLLTLIFLFPLLLNAQYFLTGQDPASVRWRQIRSDNFRIIFAAEDSLRAGKLLNLFQHSYPHIRFDLDSPETQSDVILHNKSVISNAMVGWAPRRIDFFHTPPQDGYAQEWFRQLTIHELRHLAQVSKVNRGFGKSLSVLFGQQGTAGLFGLFVPFWFVEGDAVATETAMSYSGRGRSPLFEAGLRAQLLEIGYYVYDKAYFGSFKDYTPDVYELGYYIVGHNKYKYGPAIWETPLQKISATPFTLTPFSSGIRKVSGYGKLGLYRETMFDLYEVWKQQYDSLSYTSSLQLSPVHKSYTSYTSPQNLSDGRIVALQSSMDDVNRIVSISDSQVEVLFTPGTMLYNALSAGDSLVVWCAYQPDPRWSNRDYSVIMIGDLQTLEHRQLTYQSRFFSPSLTSDGRRIAVTETAENGVNSLVMLSVTDGAELFRFSSDSLFFQTPQCIPFQEKLVAVAVGQHGKSVIMVDMTNGQFEFLIPFAYDDISLTDADENAILLSSGKSGINNIIRLDLKNRSMSQLTSSRFGADDAVFGAQGDIVYADYNSKGFAVVQLPKQQQLAVPYNNVSHQGYQLADMLSSVSTFNIDKSMIPDTIFTTKPYHKALNLFNFHSWAPFSANADNFTINPGLSLVSQNTLSTAVTTLDYSFNTNEQTGRYSLGFDYYGFYPVISLNAVRELRRGRTRYEGEIIDLKWWETSLSGGAYIPLIFYKGPWVQGFVPGINYKQTMRYMEEGINVDFREKISHSFSYSLYFYSFYKSSLRDLIPPWGLSVRSVYQHALSDIEPANQYYVGANVYIPGLVNHHGLRLHAAFEEQRRGMVEFGHLVSFPRGYTGLFFDQNLSFKVDYMFPILYPDMNIPTVLYLKRISGAMFTDVFQGKISQSSSNLVSSGLEVYSDWHFLNFPFPVTLGGRLSRLNKDGKIVAEFLFGINTSSLY
jgi:hypothetical protein